MKILRIIQKFWMYWKSNLSFEFAQMLTHSQCLSRLFLKKFNVNKKENAQTSQSFEFFYRIEDIELNENMKMKITKKFYEIETIKNNKIFKIDEISNKFFNEFDFYYLIKWKNYENAIWKSVSFVKYFRKTLRQFHNENSKKFDVNKKTNHRKSKKKWFEIFIAC